MPHGVMVAQLTLDQSVKVRILMGQPNAKHLVVGRREAAFSVGRQKNATRKGCSSAAAPREARPSRREGGAAIHVGQSAFAKASAGQAIRKVLLYLRFPLPPFGLCNGTRMTKSLSEVEGSYMIIRNHSMPLDRLGVFDHRSERSWGQKSHPALKAPQTLRPSCSIRPFRSTMKGRAWVN